jgi:hypothetical protein
MSSTPDETKKLWLREHLDMLGKTKKKATQDFSVETRTHMKFPSFTMELDPLMPEPHSKNIL